ncbi:MAG: hypothetical protein HOA47_15280 [Verrucomicrobia bacterium]|nr:hypothetical protein [Verrucomicrobiota bacterium]
MYHKCSWFRPVRDGLSHIHPTFAKPDTVSDLDLLAQEQVSENGDLRRIRTDDTTSSQRNHQTPYDPVLLIIHEPANFRANRLDVIHEMALLHD